MPDHPPPVHVALVEERGRGRPKMKVVPPPLPLPSSEALVSANTCLVKSGALKMLFERQAARSFSNAASSTSLRQTHLESFFSRGREGGGR